jgi:branched-subunit amino acid transport protein
MSAWIVVLAVGLVSYLFRAGPVLALARVELPAPVERSLRHAGPAAMAAMAALTLVHYDSPAAGAAPAAVLAVGFSMLLVRRGLPLAFVVAAGLAAYQVVLVTVRLIGGW